MIPIFRPWFGEEEVEAVREVLLSGWVGPGTKVEEFEQKFSEYVGAEHAVSLNSCSAALFLGLKALNVEGGEVITTSLTFVASNHAILQNDATPVFCDIDLETLNIDPKSIEANITPQTKAILVVHFAGHPCDMDAIGAIAQKHGLPVVEDAAHAVGARYKGKMIGGISHISCFSFDARKNLSTCDGGMLTTNDDDIAKRVKRLRWMGISKGTYDRFRKKGLEKRWEYEIDEVGYKCYMNDLNAAIGLAQLSKIEAANAQRRETFLQYGHAFADLEWLQAPVVRENVRSGMHAYVARVPDRDGLIAHLADHEIDAGVHYKPCHLFNVYEPYRRELPVTDSVWPQLVTLPLFPSMTEDNVQQVIGAVTGFQPNGSAAF
ncbi:MAG: DegT/DnrJ/EryC1/StrS family aminotransferase [Candidatus Latescibacteria bacterium]|jgi:perosamine synthetase|nr:DegT/DnrJ/EryC1/StrS family aminotransferase [Candidatus Latescibacterota bacterium]MBT4139932.1 DegT/DnrJ/EryC1/StrS family aminotransferase [Candidatus Latescibacterota bacterium]